MTSEEACQAYIDRKIPKELQPLNPSVSYIRGGWMAAMDWQRTENKSVKSENLFWCNSHQRRATHISHGEPCCDPRLGGILLPCRCVLLNGIAEIYES